MNIYDRPVIIIGLIVSLILFSYPLWNIIGSNPSQPNIQLPKDINECVAPLEYMKTSHMQLLNDWRDSVVRNAGRLWISYSGKQYKVSLTNECLRCHSDKSAFCDQCHNYLGVSPFCWDCHTYSKEHK